MLMYGIYETEMVCANCRHFYQHYVKGERLNFHPCNSGHCSYPRIKDRKPADTCKHFDSRIVLRRTKDENKAGEKA